MSYYPPGWNKDRWQSATEEEFATLSDEQFATFHRGIRADLGEDGAEDFFDEMDKRQTEVRAAASPAPAAATQQIPNFVRALDHSRAEDGGFFEWGFVVFRTAGYDDEGVVKDVKEKLEAQVDRQFDAAGGSADVQRAREKFRLTWIEQKDLDGATPQEVARRFRELTAPMGMAQSLCLCADNSSVKSFEQPGLAYMLAVSISCGLEFIGDEAEDERWTGSFKVAASSLITELFADIGDGALTPFEVGVGVTEDLIWTSASRDGRQKASVQ